MATTIIIVLIVLLLLFFGFERQRMKNRRLDTFVRLPMCYNTGAYDYRYPASCNKYEVGPHQGSNKEYH